MDKDKIIVAMCSDERGADFMQVAIKSLFYNNRNEDIELHIITDGFSNITLEALKEIESCYGKEILIHTIDASRFEIVPGAGDKCAVPKGTLFRFLLPEVLSLYEKVIYIDTDIIVLQSLAELWNIEVSNYAMAGVIDPGDSAVMQWHIVGGLGFDKGEYVNAGVLLMNLTYFRDNDISKRCIEWLIANPDKALLCDQTALNVILRGNIKYIHPKFNLQHFHFCAPDGSNELERTGALEEARNNPVIRHFTIFKPWQRIGLPNLPYDRDKYEFYRKLTPQTSVVKRKYDDNILRRRLFYALYRLHLTSRKPSLIQGLIGLDKDIK